MYTGKIKGVIWHHTGGTQALPLASTQHHTAETIDASHKTRWPGFTSDVYSNESGKPYHCGYNTVIETANKKRVRTREYGEETAAAIGYNTGYIHVVITGNYDTGADVWDTGVNKLIIDEWAEIKASFPYLTVGDNKPHRAYSNRSCFGSSLPDNHIQRILAKAETDTGKSYKEVELEMKVSQLEQVNALYEKLVALLYIALTGKRFSSREV